MPRDALGRPVLTSVAVVVRDGSGRVTVGCPEVVQLVSAFINYSVHWEIYSAAGRGSLHLLEFCAVRVMSKQHRDNRFQVALSVAVGKGDMAAVQLLHRFHPHFQLQASVLESAAEEGRLEIAQWLHARRRMTCGWDALWWALLNGDLAMLDWLHAMFPEVEFQGDSMVTAVQSGSLEVVQWLHDHEVSCSTAAMNKAAANGYLVIVRWLHTNCPEGCTQSAMDGAAENGHLEVVQWLHDNRNEGCTVEAMDQAARYGHLEVVQWLHFNRSEGCTQSAMDGAAHNGHLEVVQWLHNNRDEGCSVKAMGQAARYGHLEVVQWLHDNRTEGCCVAALHQAAWKSHLGVVQWLHANRTENFTLGAMGAAVEKGNLPLVQWLHEHRTEGGYLSGMRPARRGEAAIVAFLNENRPGTDWVSAVYTAWMKGHRDIVQYLWANRPPSMIGPDELRARATLTPNRVLEWLDAVIDEHGDA